MATNYYFLAGLLPEITIGMPVSMSFRELDSFLQANLSEADYEKVAVLRRFYDLENIRLLYREEESSPYGNWDEVQLDEVLLTGSGAPEYLQSFLERHEESHDRLHHFPRLIADYFNSEKVEEGSFLSTYLTFEREWRLVSAAFRAKSTGRDIGQELRYEDPTDELVAQIIAQKDSPAFEPPARFERLKGLFEKHVDNPLDLHKAMCEYRSEVVGEMIEADFFSLDRIMGYIAQLIIAERWLELDQQAGMEIVDEIVKDVS